MNRKVLAAFAATGAAALPASIIAPAAAKSDAKAPTARAAATCTFVAEPNPGTPLYLRSGPGTNYAIIGSVSAGTKVRGSCYPFTNGFSDLSSPTTGWANVEYLASPPG